MRHVHGNLQRLIFVDGSCSSFSAAREHGHFSQPTARGGCVVSSELRANMKQTVVAVFASEAKQSVATVFASGSEAIS